jgi:lipopolysaccharide/colanic/teichoic acid biosynthesis glycosyltransferase
MVLLFPVILMAAAAIRIESEGPVLFKQQRLGFKGRTFTIWKLRTMIVNAEETGTTAWSFKGDARITKVGAFLRKTSLDEIPQLLNVLKGEMSLIGPRPPLTWQPYKLEDYPKEFKKRFDVLPGITGLAQINGRKELPWDKRLALDKAYVENLSFRLDVKIFFKTILKVLLMQGCYNVHPETGNPGKEMLPGPCQFDEKTSQRKVGKTIRQKKTTL